MVHRGSRWVSVLSTSSARRSGRSQHNTKRISVLPRCITWDFRSAPYFYYADMFRIISYKAIGKMLEISHDVTAAILLFQNNKTTAILVFQTNLVGVELFSSINSFFCSNTWNLHRCWPREWKRYSMRLPYGRNKLGYGAVQKSYPIFCFLKKEMHS